MREIIYKSPYLFVTRDAEKRLFCAVRSAERLTSEAAEEMLHEMLLHVPRPLRRGYFLLFDTRQAPVLANPELEQRFAEYGRPFFEGFTKVAAVVRTAVGKLQVTRLARDEKLKFLVFTDEDEALTWLLE